MIWKTGFFGLLCVLAIACSRSIPQTTTSPDDPFFQVELDAEGQPKKAKNVIFLIGDGMGLGQITGGMYANWNRTVFEKFPVVGLHKSHSSNNLVTDSAAGATAFSCGIKTYNGAIGVDQKGNSKRSIMEYAKSRGKATGLVATSTIVHATPAAFYAHVKSRRLYEKIAEAFLRADIDLAIGGGKKYFSRRTDGRDLTMELSRHNYVVYDFFETKLRDLPSTSESNLIYLTADADPLPRQAGRDYLIPAAKFSLDFLSQRSEEGFFVMIEGSQIDWGGHANNGDYVISEYLEFEKVIDLAYQFARKDGNTLVLVTADHETGGLAINPDSEMGRLNFAFTTGGHTACLIPVFAYGPGAGLFGGMYDNTEIFEKLRQAMDL